MKALSESECIRFSQNTAFFFFKSQAVACSISLIEIESIDEPQVACMSHFKYWKFLSWKALRNREEKLALVSVDCSSATLGIQGFPWARA